jgi:endoglucanase Acf2
MIARAPEFGNEKLNDHHFHYGYFIRAAAVLVRADPSFLPRVKTQIGQLVDDIANPNRTSGQYPYLRNFDVYEGHSWADGFAKFADGNDQESSSEAINAWYAVYLWSRITHDSQLESTALYLYTTEVESAKEYWFGTAGLLAAPYQHRLASLVWGGKVDFGTWFSSNPNAIYGIQLLPITPASTYLGQLPGISAYTSDLEAAGGRLDGYWGDLLLAWLSYYAPHEALAKAGAVGSSQLNGPRSLLLYTIYRNLQLHPAGP